MSTTKKLDYYGPEMAARRERFNNIIRGIDMVLMNNIPAVDSSVLDNWQDESPFFDCDVIDVCNAMDDKIMAGAKEKGVNYWCQEHEQYTDMTDQCDYCGEGTEVYQWFAVNSNDADFLQRHNQYITYSDLLDTYFLAICHCGTSWDYVDSMVNDILGDK